MDPTTDLTAQITAQVLSHIAEVKKLDGLEKCHKYAMFLKHASAGEANAIFWSLFIFDIVLLAIASLLWSSQDKHHRNFEKAAQDIEADHDLQTLEMKKRRSHERVVLASILCFLIALPSVIIETFAGFSITFCHKEDFPFLYWGSFFLLSVGSLIAIMGLSFGIIFSHRRPPWNLNLGTPVLVIAGLVHLAWDVMRDQVRKLQGKEPKTKKNGTTDSGSPVTKTISLACSANDKKSPLYQMLKMNTSGMVMVTRFIGTSPDGKRAYLELVQSESPRLSDPGERSIGLSSPPRSSSAGDRLIAGNPSNE